jgi:hypothetical protein
VVDTYQIPTVSGSRLTLGGIFSKSVMRKRHWREEDIQGADMFVDDHSPISKSRIEDLIKKDLQLQCRGKYKGTFWIRGLSILTCCLSRPTRFVSAGII